MNKKQNFDPKIEETLKSLDGLEKAKTDHFYFSRLEAKIAEKNSSDRRLLLHKNKKWQLSLAALFLLLIINIATALKITGGNEQQEQAIEYFVQDYDLHVDTFYDTEIN